MKEGALARCLCRRRQGGGCGGQRAVPGRRGHGVSSREAPTGIILGPRTTVFALLTAYPFLDQVLLGYGEAFLRLGTPGGDTGWARKVTLGDVALDMNVTWRRLVREISDEVARVIGGGPAVVGSRSPVAEDDWRLVELRGIAARSGGRRLPGGARRQPARRHRRPGPCGGAGPRPCAGRGGRRSPKRRGQERGDCCRGVRRCGRLPAPARTSRGHVASSSSHGAPALRRSPRRARAPRRLGVEATVARIPQSRRAPGPPAFGGGTAFSPAATGVVPGACGAFA